jgi:hypothetical protein
MAAAQHKLSRRALLGAACAAPILVASGSRAGAALRESAPDRRWTGALSRYRRAEAALEKVAHTEDDHLYDRHLGQLNNALRRLLRTPAPHLAAMAAKLDLLVEHQAWELTQGDLCMAALRRDAHQFAGRWNDRTRESAQGAVSPLLF